MKAVRLHKFHSTPVVDDVPEPKVTGPLDVVVKIGGAGVCRTDLHIIEGQWDERMHTPLPYILGHENAGWVHEIGSAVTNVAVGDTVILHPTPTCGLCRACRAGDDMHCENSTFPGLSTDGGMAEYLLTSARACVKLDPVDAAAGCGGARRRRDYRLSRGEEGDPAAVSRDDLRRHRGRRARAYRGAVPGGADRGADHRRATGIPRRSSSPSSLAPTSPWSPTGSTSRPCKDLTGGAGAHVVLDFVAEQGAEMDGWNMTAPAGSYFVIGYGGTLHIPTLDIISTERNIIGNIVGTYNELAELMALAQGGKVTLHTKTYPLAAAPDALADLDAGRVRGRAILVP